MAAKAGPPIMSPLLFDEVDYSNREGTMESDEAWEGRPLNVETIPGSWGRITKAKLRAKRPQHR